MSEEKKAAVTRYHRKTLLDAADRLLMQYGYAGMNMNMLAKEAGYSKATVYVYLESKDEIVRLLSIDRLKLLRKEFAVILKNADMPVSEKLADVKAVLDEFVAEDKTYFDFICSSEFADELSDRSDSEKELSALVDGIFADLTALVPAAELKAKWYAYYGEKKTGSMFSSHGGRS